MRLTCFGDSSPSGPTARRYRRAALHEPDIVIDDIVDAAYEGVRKDLVVLRFPE